MTACLLMPLVSHANMTGLDSTTGIPGIIASPGDTGSFEIDLAIPAPVIAETITAFSLTLTATPTTATGLLFTGVSMETTPDPYIFAGVSANGSTFSLNQFPNTTFTVADSDTNTAGVTVTTDTTFGLVEVSYSVDPNATPGTYLLTTDLTLSETGSPGTLTPPATFTIVPEPGSGVLTGLASLAGLGVFAGVRRRVAVR